MVRGIAVLLGFLTVAFTIPAFAQPPAFERLDRDGNGSITKQELPSGVRPLFERLDTNSDGGISRDEHQTAIQRMKRQRTGRSARAPEGVNITRDIPYTDTENRRQMLDLALPEEPTTEEPLPVVVFIHGGAWRGGDRAFALNNLVPLVRSGRFAGVSVGYRLSGEVVWPAQLHDCQAALRWIKGNAKEHNLDPQRIVVWGSSAGGHLVAMLGVSADESKLDGNLGPHTDQSLEVSGVIDYFGPANLPTMGDQPSKMDHNAPNSPESLLLGGPILENQEKARAASPQSYISKGDPPFLIMHGTKDDVVPFQQSVEFHKALRAAGVDSTFIQVEGAGHGFGGPQVFEKVEAFLQKVLLGEEIELKDGTVSSAARQ